MEIVEEETRPDTKMKVKSKAKFVQASNIIWINFEQVFVFCFHPPGYSVADQGRKLIHDLKKILSKMLIVRLEILPIFRDTAVVSNFEN